MGEDCSIGVGEAEICSKQGEKPFALLMYFGFFLVGVVSTLLGPILPMLASRWHLGDGEVGWLFLAQFAGGIVGSALSSRMIGQFGLLRLMTYGYVTTAAALVLLGISSWEIGLLLVLSFGFALGLTGPAISLLVAEINSERRAAALNILGFSWALGAVAGPPLIALSAGDEDLLQPLIGLAALLLGVAVLIGRRAFADAGSGPFQRTPGSRKPARLAGSSLRAWASPYALLTGGLIFIYVGTETATSGWISTYAQRLGAPTSGLWTMTPSIFWMGLMIGRAVAPAVLSLVNDAWLVLGSLFMAGAGLLIILLGSNLVAVTLGVGLAGLGMAAVFPTTFAIFTRFFGARASELAGSFYVMGGLGGALIPLLVGIASGGFGDLRVGLLIPTLGVASMIVLQILIIRALARKHSRPA